MPLKRRKKPSKKKSKGRGASNDTAASTEEAVPSSTASRDILGEDNDVLAWIQNGGDAPPQVIRNEKSYQDAVEQEKSKIPPTTTSASSHVPSTEAKAVISPAAQSLLHKDDDIERVLECIQRSDGKVSGARLAKRMPHTSQRLRTGEVSVDDFANQLYEQVVSRSKVESAQRLRGMRGLFTLDFGLVAISKALTRRILPTTMRSFYFEVVVDMHYNLRRAVREAAKTDEWKASAPKALSRALKQVFDETCAEWEERLDARLFSGHPSGTFRQCCSLFEAPLKEFDKLLAEDFYCRLGDVSKGDEVIYACLVWDATRMDDRVIEDFLRRNLHASTYAIACGADNGYNICWECGIQLKKTTKECAGCKAALYCGRECQIKAWRSGHKGMCATLLAEHENFLASLQAADDAHCIGVLEGVRLSQVHDYTQLVSLHTVTSSFFLEYGSIGQPSMKFFYENLARVIHGEWWVFGEGNTASAAELEQLLRKPRDEKKKICGFDATCSLLSFDYFGYAERTYGIVDPKQVTALLETTPMVVTAVNVFEVVLPPDIFLEMYNEYGGLAAGNNRWKVRKMCKYEVLDNFREQLHKTNAAGGGDDSSVGRADATGVLGFNEGGIGRSTRKSFFSMRTVIKILICLLVVVTILFAFGFLPRH